MHQPTVVAILLLLTLTFSSCEKGDTSASSNTKVTYEKSVLNPYPEAVRVNLLVGDKAVRTSFEEKDLRKSSQPEGYDLTDAERRQFENSIQGVKIRNAGPDTPMMSMSACFVPHHFFRYYDRSDNLVGEISVCFCCYDYRAAPKLTSIAPVDYVEMDFETVENLVAEMGHPTDIACE